MKKICHSILLFALCASGFSSASNDLEYTPYENTGKARLQDLTRIALGVGLCVGACMTAQCALSSYSNNKSHVLKKGWAALKDGMWSILYRSKVTDAQSAQTADVIKKYLATVFWGTSTVVFGAAGLNLISQGLHLRDSDQEN